MIDRMLDAITIASWTGVGLALIAAPIMIASVM